MLNYIMVFLLAMQINSVTVSSPGVKGQGADKHILLVAKNTGKSTLKNIRVSCVLKLKMNVKGQQSVIERDEVFDIPALAPGRTFEWKASANAAVVECTGVGKTEIFQR